MEFVILFNEMRADRIQVIVLAVNQVKIRFDEVLQRTGPNCYQSFPHPAFRHQRGRFEAAFVPSIPACCLSTCSFAICHREPCPMSCSTSSGPVPDSLNHA